MMSKAETMLAPIGIVGGGADIGRLHDDLPLLSDAQLIDACLAGQEEAWQRLLERYSRLIYAVPLRMGLPPYVAEEIFQQTCVILLEKLETLRNRERLNAWIVTVTRRACIDYLRQIKQVSSLDEIEFIPAIGSMEENVCLSEQQALVRQALANLEPRCQQLLTSLFFEASPSSYEALAQEFAIPLGSVGPIRARCLDKLRQEILNLDKKEYSAVGHR